MAAMPSFVIAQDAASSRFASAIVEIKARAGARHALDQLTELIDEKSDWERRHVAEREELTVLGERAASWDEQQALRNRRFAHEIDRSVVAIAFDQVLIALLAEELKRLHRQVSESREP